MAAIDTAAARPALSAETLLVDMDEVASPSSGPLSAAVVEGAGNPNDPSSCKSGTQASLDAGGGDEATSERARKDPVGSPTVVEAKALCANKRKADAEAAAEERSPAKLPKSDEVALLAARPAEQRPSHVASNCRFRRSITRTRRATVAPLPER